MIKIKKDLNITVECAAVIALCTILSYIKIFRMPYGGSITLASMAPLMLLSFRRGAKIGLCTGFTYGLLRIILSFDIPPAGNFMSLILVCIMDYLLAYVVIGLASVFTFGIRKKSIAIFAAAFTAGFIKYVISVLSGVLIWQNYVAHEQSVWIYSTIYNASYMLPEIIIASFACALVGKYLRFI